MPRFSWINSLHVFLLLSSSLFLLYGSIGWASPVVRGEPTAEEQFQISDAVFRGKVLRIDHVSTLEGRFEGYPSGSQDEIAKQSISDSLELKGTCAPEGPNTLERFFMSVPLTDDEPTWSGIQEVEFKVRKSWKGTKHNKMTVHIACHLESCLYPFNVGDTYLVFVCSERVRDDEKGSFNEYLWTDFYSANRKLDNSREAKDMIQLLEALQADDVQEDSNDGGSPELRINEEAQDPK